MPIVTKSLIPNWILPMRVGKKKSSLRRLITAYKTSWKMRLASKLVLLGLVYGYISGLQNQNPYYPIPGRKECMMVDENENYHRAWDWQPSPFWLPSYLLCKVPGEGERLFGIAYTRSGYYFYSNADRFLYMCSSSILGGGIGLIIAMAIIRIRILKQRKKQTGPVEHGAPPL